jgi:hypothetical protein
VQSLVYKGTSLPSERYVMVSGVYPAVTPITYELCFDSFISVCIVVRA